MILRVIQITYGIIKYTLRNMNLGRPRGSPLFFGQTKKPSRVLLVGRPAEKDSPKD